MNIFLFIYNFFIFKRDLFIILTSVDVITKSFLYKKI